MSEPVEVNGWKRAARMTHSALVAAAAYDMEQLEAERDQWRRVAQEAQEMGVTMYRKGYLAGRAAKRRGDPAVTNPERHARSETRRLLGV